MTLETDNSDLPV